MLKAKRTSQFVTSDLIKDVVQAAIRAPSAENTQPWQFLYDGSELLICLDQSRSLASDVDCMLDLTSLGACLENAVIAARDAGYEPTVMTVFDTGQAQQLDCNVPVAKIGFGTPGSSDPLFPYLSDRCTSRRMHRTAIEQPQLEELSAGISLFPAVQLDWVTEPQEMRQIGHLLGIGNRIRFEHEPFHREFYENIRATQQAVEATNDGLDIATLQLPPGVASILSFLRRWPRMKIANALGFSRSVARQAAAEVRSSGALGILTVNSAHAEDFLQGGRALERLWLSATAANLGFHPAAALAVFMAYAERTDGTLLLPKHQQMAENMQQRFYRLYPHLSGRTVQMVFRLGYADLPEVRSLRRDVNDVLEFSDKKK